MIAHRTGIARQLAPVAAVGLLAIAGSAAHAAANATGEPGTTALTVGVVAFVLAVLVAMKLGQRIKGPGAARLAMLLTGSAAWLGTVTATGVTWSAFEVLALMVGALSLHWWRAHRIPSPAAVSAAEPTSEADDYAERWEEYLGGKGCPLAGTRLARAQVIEAGVRYSLMLTPGKHDRGTITGAVEKVRGGLGLRTHQDLIVEPHPDLPEPHQQLTIVTRSPIREEVIWPGPSTFVDGSVALGPFADGIGVARWRVYAGPRIKGGYMQGGTGSGKSRAFEAVAIAVAASETHPTVIMYADGQDDASSPMLAEHADHMAGNVAEFREMLAGLLRVKDFRQLENGVERRTGFTPTADRPGVLVLVDEQHKFTGDPVIQAAMTELAREGEKVGIALIGASQDSLLSAFGGSGQSNNAEVLRSSMLMGNGLVFASKAKDVKQVFGISIDPSTFPPIPGYAYVVSPVPGARSAPLRCYHFTDAQAKVIPQKIRWRELDPGAANAYGPAYRDRKIIAERRRQEKVRRLEEIRNGAPVTTERPEPPITRTVPVTTAPAPTVAQFPVWSSIPVPRPADGPRVAEVHRKVVAAIEGGEVLKNGFTMPHLVAKHLGYSVRWASDALGDLVTLGVLEQREGAPMGRYYPTGKRLERAA